MNMNKYRLELIGKNGEVVNTFYTEDVSKASVIERLQLYYNRHTGQAWQVTKLDLS